MPGPEDFTRLASDIEADDGDVPPSPHVTAAVKHLRTAAHVMSTGDHAGALRLLRTTQTDLNALTRGRQAKVRQSTANVFAGRVPPAEQSSARAEMVGHIASTNRARQHNVRLAAHIHAIRRHVLHGVYSGSPAQRV